MSVSCAENNSFEIQELESQVKHMRRKEILWKVAVGAVAVVSIAAALFASIEMIRYGFAANDNGGMAVLAFLVVLPVSGFLATLAICGIGETAEKACEEIERKNKELQGEIERLRKVFGCIELPSHPIGLKTVE